MAMPYSGDGGQSSADGLARPALWTQDQHYRSVIKRMLDDKAVTKDQYDTIMAPRNLDDLIGALKSMPVYDSKKRRWCSPTRLWTGFIARLDRFDKALNTFAQVDSTCCVIWGTLKVVIEVSKDMSESLALIRSGVSKLLGVIEHAELDYSIMKDESTFRFRSEAESLLVNLYQHSMEFFLASLQFLARRRSKQFAGLVIASLLRRKAYKASLEDLLARVIESGDAIFEAGERYHWHESHISHAIDRREHTEVIDLLQGRRLAGQPSPKHRSDIRSLQEIADWGHHILDGAPLGSFFVGRETELKQMHDTFRDREEQLGSYRVILSGLSGIGKSHLASKYASSSSDEYKMMFWMDCSTPGSLMESHDRLVEMLDLTEPLEGRTTVFRLQVTKRLLNETENPWLIVMDNCTLEVTESVLSLIPPSQGHLIFTTGDEEVARRLVDDAGCLGRASPSRIVLGDLSDEESRRLLLIGLPEEQKQQEESAVAQLVQRIHGHPLSLRLVRASTKHSGAPAAYSETLLRVKSFADMGNPLQTSSSRLSVYDAVKVALSRLSPTARLLLDILACFHHNNIPTYLIDLIPDIVADDPDAASPTVIPCPNASSISEGLAEAERYSLVRVHAVKRRTVLSIHPVVANTIRALHHFHDPQRRSLRLAVDLLNRALPDYGGGYLKIRDVENAEYLHAHAAWLETYARDMGCPTQISGSIGVLFKIACQKYFAVGDLKGAEQIALSVLGDLHGVLDGLTDAEFAFAILLCRIWGSFALRAYEKDETTPYASTFAERVLRSAVRRFPINDGRIPMLMQYVASAKISNDINRVAHIGEVLEICQSVADKMESVFGPVDARTLCAYASRAREKAVANVGDRGAAELQLIHQRLDRTEVKDSISVASLYYSLGRTYTARGDHEMANLYHYLGLQNIRGRVSSSHPHLGWHLWSYIQTFCDPGQWENLSVFLQEEPLLESYRSARYSRVWMHDAAHFATLYTDHFFRDIFTSSGSMQDCVDHVDLCSYWQVEAASTETAKLPDTAYDAAVFLDTWNTATADSFVDSAASLVPRPNTVEPKRITQTRSCKQAIHGIIRAALWGLCGYEPSSLPDWGEAIATACPAKQGQTSFTAADQDYTDAWDQIWRRLQPYRHDISVDEIEVEDQYYGIPKQFTSYLIEMVVLGSVEGVKAVLRQSPNVHAENQEGRTAFYYAAKLHHFALLKLLFGATAETPKFYFSNSTLLHLVCVSTWQRYDGAEDDQMDVVKETLWRGHKTTICNAAGLTPAALADEHGLREIAATLRAHYGKFRR